MAAHRLVEEGYPVAVMEMGLRWRREDFPRTSWPIPQASRFGEQFAQLVGGTALRMLPEVLFNVPGTAHCVGGRIMANSRDHGVVDYANRVFG